MDINERITQILRVLNIHKSIGNRNLDSFYSYGKYVFTYDPDELSKISVTVVDDLFFNKPFKVNAGELDKIIRPNKDIITNLHIDDNGLILFEGLPFEVGVSDDKIDRIVRELYTKEVEPYINLHVSANESSYIELTMTDEVKDLIRDKNIGHFFIDYTNNSFEFYQPDHANFGKVLLFTKCFSKFIKSSKEPIGRLYTLQDKDYKTLEFSISNTGYRTYQFFNILL